MYAIIMFVISLLSLLFILFLQICIYIYIHIYPYNTHKYVHIPTLRMIQHLLWGWEKTSCAALSAPDILLIVEGRCVVRWQCHGAHRVLDIRTGTVARTWLGWHPQMGSEGCPLDAIWIRKMLRNHRIWGSLLRQLQMGVMCMVLKHVLYIIV